MDIDFSRLEQLSVKLNQSSEALNESLKQVEAKFAQLRLGVEGFVAMDKYAKTDDTGRVFGEIVTYFAYAKRHGRWGLFFIDLDEGDEELSCEAFAQSGREIRLKALKKVPELIKHLEQRAEELLKELRSCQASAGSILESKS